MSSKEMGVVMTRGDGGCTKSLFTVGGRGGRVESPGGRGGRVESFLRPLTGV